MSKSLIRRTVPEPVFILRSVIGEVTSLHSMSLPIEDRDSVLITGHGNGELQLWDLKIYRVKLSWLAHPENRIQWVNSSNDGRIFSYGRDGLVHAWNVIVNPTGLTAIKVLTVTVDCFTHCPCDITSQYGDKSLLLAAPNNDISVAIHDVLHNEDVKSVMTIQSTSKRGMIMMIKFIEGQHYMADSRSLLIAYENGCLTNCRLNDGIELSCLDASTEIMSSADETVITCMDFHSGTMKGILGATTETLVTFSVSDIDGVIRIDKRVTITNPGVACIRVRPDGKYCVTGGWDKRIRVLSWKTLKLLAVIELHIDIVQGLSFLAKPTDGFLLVAGSRDGRISTWDLYNEIKST